jgi:hypothetical protein
MTMTAQKCLYSAVETIMHVRTHSPGAGGATEKCAICGELHGFITIRHAKSHGYEDRNEMIKAGKIICWQTGKPLKPQRSRITRLEK